MYLFRNAQRVRFLTGIAIVILWVGVRSALSLENGVGRTPAMGYNPWNSFLITPTLETLKEMIDSMVSNGMRDAGYIYMCTDGGPFMWGPDSALQAFTDYGHRKGFKIGYYAQNISGNEATLIAKWARMGFDYLKHDYYMAPWTDLSYYRVRQALKTIDRQVYLTIHASNFAPAPDTVCNAQRVGNDINWKKDSLYWGPTSNNGLGVMGEVMASRNRQNLAHPGYFNDMDMMGVGMTGFINNVEAQTHFNFWCIMASILIEGSDLRRIPKERLNILLNREVIAVNQDSLGEQGRVVWSRYAAGDSTEVISKRMKDSSRAVMLFNRNGPTKSITVRLRDIGLTGPGPVHVRDLWRHDTLPNATDSVTISGIVQHGSAMLRIGKNPLSNIGYNPPKVWEQKNSPKTGQAVCLFNTRISTGLQLSSEYSGIQVFSLQGALLWESRPNGMGEDGLIRVPASLKNAGMVVVRKVKP